MCHLYLNKTGRKKKRKKQARPEAFIASTRQGTIGGQDEGTIMQTWTPIGWWRRGGEGNKK